MRWWLILSVTLLWSKTTAQPVKDIDSLADQSTPRKCCPCPEDLEADQAAASSATAPRTAGLDCSSFRDADSAGAQSILFPHTLFGESRRRPVVNLEDEKEELQPLLKPEVDLASSVVNTLRESTDEDYRDALQRDAARNAARAFKTDENTVKNLINAFGKDNDSKDTEETNPTKLFSDILRLALPKPETLKKLFDKDSSAGASSINEQRIAAKNRNDGAKIISKLDPLNLFSEDSPLRKTNINFFKVGERLNSDHSKSAIDPVGRSKPLLLPKIANVFPNADLRKFVQNNDNVAGKSVCADSHFSPSNINERYYPKDTKVDSISDNKRKLTHEQADDNMGENRTQKLLKNTPKSTMTYTNRDATSDLLKDMLKGLEQSRNIWNIPDIFNLGRNVSNENANSNKNKKIEDTTKQQETEIIEVADTNTMNSLNALNGNNIFENENISEKNPIQFNRNLPNKDYTNTKIITHIPTGNSEEYSDVESVDNIEQINEISNGDEYDENSSNMNSPQSLLLFPGTSGNTPEFSQQLLPQARSAGKMNNGVRKPSNFLNGFEKLKAPAMHSLFKSQNNILSKKYEGGSKQVSMNDLQHMSDSLLGKETSRNNPSFQKKDVDDSNAKFNTVVLSSSDAKTSEANGIRQIKHDEKDCPSYKVSAKSANDMTSEASEHVPNIFENFRAPQIAQPFTLFEDIENPLDRLNENLEDIFGNSLPAPLLPNILSGDDLISRVDEGISALPSLPTLEDLNLPNLNLDLPRPIDLTPFNLRSTMGNAKAADLFSSPITLPDIDDISESFLENVQNLITPPLETSRNVLEGTLRSGQVLSDNLREQTRSAVNHLHKNIGHTLKDAGLSELPNLENPLVSGANMLEDLRARHEDFGEKIKGIHYDLTDRLETIRNNILDHLPDLDPSMLAESSNVVQFREPLYQNLPRSGNFLNDRRKVSRPHLLAKSATPLLTAFPKSYTRPLYVKSNTAAKSPLATTSPVMKRKNNAIISKSKPNSKSIPRGSINKPTFPSGPAKATKLSKTLNRPRPSKPNSALNTPMKGSYGFKSTNAVNPSSGKRKPYSHGEILRSASPAQVPNMLLPKHIDETLAKVRDAVKDRLSSLTPNRDAGNPILGTISDMAKSASRNVETVKVNPDLMKQNTPYSCKMVCAKI